MKFHWSLLILLVLAYFVGVKFAGPGQTILSKVGL